MHKRILESIYVCLVYAICSMSFSFAAKFLFKIFAFHNTTLLLLYETTVNIVVCTFIMIKRNRKNAIKKIETQISLYENMKIIFMERFKLIKQTIPYSLTYGAGVLCGMKALSLINIPLFLALRRTLIFFVFLFQFVLGHSQELSYQFIGSIILITSGAIIAGFQHFNDDLYGYALVIANNMLSAFALHLAKRLNQKNNLGPLELVFNNSLNLWPILLAFTIFSQDFQSILQFEFLYRTEFLLSITMVAVIGFLLNVATNNCTMKNSPFAIALTHNIKDIFSTIISLLIFTDIQVDRYLLAGIGMSFCGSFIYSFYKMQLIKSQIGQDQKSIELPNVETKELIEISVKD